MLLFLRRALVDAQLARLAAQNEWEGLVVYGSVRQVDELEELEIGIQAIAAIPAGAAGEGIGESDVRINFGGDTSELCDIYHEEVNVVEPLFSNFGGRTSFGGQITTVKCFEDNGLLYDLLEENGRGRVLLVDGGGSVRRRRSQPLHPVTPF
ncbi:hypothetical protein CRX72_28915 [Pantoea sp. BRM17]|nr:hypothetical protein CRX72_28915 [Pantoea sp. BRM17]